MIGLLDLDLLQKSSMTHIVPNLEIMKLSSYYRNEKNIFCKLMTLDETDLSIYDKIYCFSEQETLPTVPEAISRAKNVIYGGTGFTTNYEPFSDVIIDYMFADKQIYKNYLKQRYHEGVKTKIINSVLDDTYYRMYAGAQKLPIPVILPRKHIYIYDKDFFKDQWWEILQEIIARKPSKIICIHAPVCTNLTNFFLLRDCTQFARTNTIILDLNIPLENVGYMLKTYQHLFLADITQSSQVYLPIGGQYATKSLYFIDFIYKLNLLYSFWSRGILMKVKVRPTPPGFYNPLYHLERSIEQINFLKKPHYTLTLNDKIPAKKKNNTLAEEKALLLAAHPSASNLFEQSFNELKRKGRWYL